MRTDGGNYYNISKIEISLKLSVLFQSGIHHTKGNPLKSLAIVLIPHSIKGKVKDKSIFCAI